MRCETVLLLAAGVCLLWGTRAALAVEPLPEEMARMQAFVAEHFGEKPAGVPYSFVYDGKPFQATLGMWETARRTETLDAARTQHTLTCTDPATGLEVVCVAVSYNDFPVVEWTVHLKNGGREDTPLVENVHALDLAFTRADGREFLLHSAQGSQATRSDYAPRETVLNPTEQRRFGGEGGRPTNKDWAYFNVEWTGAGLILAVGWPGQWAAEFQREGATGLRVRAGQELTRFKLLPGEQVRTPLIALLFWQGDDWVRAQNLWRRWMLAHNLPRPGGRLPEPMMEGCSSRAYEEMINANEQNQIAFIDRYLEEDLGADVWWMDAGWYVQEKGWPQVGTWEVDRKRFPNGLRAITDHAHAKGLRTLVWFEPERVAPETWLAENHPEWVLGGRAGGLLNLGNPDAWNWLVNHIDTLLTEQGIDIYRQDFNMDPLALWRANDAADRQGITENKHVTGYLAFWDELLRRRPGMLIDTCASGGRRNDLETLRRAVPLWRSDYAFEPVGHQCMMYGLSLWAPYHGTGTVATAAAPYYGGGHTPVEAYAFWSNASPSLSCGVDLRVREIDYGALRTLFRQWRRVSPYYAGDFYPLTAHSLESHVWMAWQFDRPDLGEGMVQAFRRADSPYEAGRFRLRGLDPEARYTIAALGDGAEPREALGKDLLSAGLAVPIPERPGVAVLVYKRMEAAAP